MSIKININFSNKQTLQIIPGIGPKIAQRIINYRKKNGNFVYDTHIMNVPYIKQYRFNLIKKHINRWPKYFF
jgi:competence protein ComEA